jgi:protein involved in polysaccharide export with SLBB domain
MKFKRISSVLIFMLLTLSIGVFSEVTEEQKKLLETLPPDQRNSVMSKMETANALEDDLEETFENSQNLVERPNYDDLANLKRQQDGECGDCIFGYDFFKYAPTTFAPVNNIPVSSDYILGPGDKLQVNLYGNKTDKFQSFISREGSFFLPPLGPVNLLGLNFNDASELIKQRIKNELIGTNASVSLSEIRSINVYMLGEVYQPGKYTMSGLSSLSNALIVSGGVNENGSLRNIQVKRDGLIVANYDFYEFLLQGSLENDIKLLDGDVIFVPFIEDRVRTGGAFKRPGIYEIIKGETVKDVINLAGGFEPNVPKNSKIELSFYDELSSSRKFSSLEPNQFNREVYGESSINVSSLIGYKVETIKLSGEFTNPGEYAIRPNDTILDVIKRAGGYSEDSYSDGGVFLRRSVARLQKQAFLRSADDLEETIADIVTKGTLSNLSEFTLSPISRLISRLRSEEPLGRMVTNLDFLSLKSNPSINFRIQDGDELFIPKRPNSISVVGEVLSASTSGFDPSKDVFDYINVAGGLKDSADTDKIFIILPDGRSSLVKKSLFSSKNLLIPGSTIVVSRDPRPFDAINLTKIITPILADLATSAAAIAAISD